MNLLLILSLVSSACALEMLFHITVVGKSHLGYANALIDTLVERGHTVDVIMGGLNTLAKPKQLHKGVRRWYYYGFLNGDSPWMKVEHLEQPFKKQEGGSTGFFYECEVKLCREAVTSAELSQWIREKKYDAGLTSDYGHCGQALFHANGVPPTALFTPTPLLLTNNAQIGLNAPPGYVVDWMLGKDEKLSGFRARFSNLLYMIRLHTQLLPESFKLSNDLFRSVYGSSFPSAMELSSQYPLIFVNSNELIDLPRPISHKVKYIGGIGMGQPKPISEEFDKLLGQATKGSVIFSFGTQVPMSRVPIEARTAFLNAFSHFPEYNFLWKYDKFDGDSLDFQNSTNVFPISWLPQTDLLRDKRVKGFISHMGMNSLLEGVYSGVPFISIPVFADQYHNSMMVRERGVAVVVDKTKVTEESMVNAIRELLYNNKYHEASTRLAHMLATKPEQPRDSFAEWVEFSAEYPTLASHITLPSTRLSIVEEYCLDCFAVLAIFLAVAAWATVRVVSAASSLVRVRRVKNKVQ